MPFQATLHLCSCWLLDPDYKVSLSPDILSYCIYLCGINSCCSSLKLKSDYATIFRVQEILSHMIKAIIISVVSGMGDAPDFVELGEAGIAMDDAMRRQRRVQLVG